MLHELVLAHALRENATDSVTSLHGLSWQTCLRKLVFSQRGAPAPSPSHVAWEFYHAERAYQFLLEIVCGLHSPLLGETEVLGQFREFCAAAAFPKNHWGQFLRQLTADLLRDAKRIRQAHLQHLGNRSYGSLASRQLAGLPVVAVLGAGQLAQEMLPALLEQTEVRIFARAVSRASSACIAQPGLSIHAWQGELVAWPDAPAGLVIAAPLRAHDICGWVERQNASFTRVLDLRGEAACDPLRLKSEVIDLRAFFASLQSERRHAAQRAQAARAAIAQLAQRQLRQVQCRPYGWEDLCA